MGGGFDENPNNGGSLICMEPLSQPPRSFLVSAIALLHGSFV